MSNKCCANKSEGMTLHSVECSVNPLNELQHTPTPFVIDLEGDPTGCVIAGNGILIGRMDTPEDATFFVNPANCHEAFKQFIERAIDERTPIEALRIIGRALIAKAEGK